VQVDAVHRDLDHKEEVATKHLGEAVQ